MNKYSTWFLASMITASTGLPAMVKSAEVLVSSNTLSQSTHIRTLAASCAACHGSNGNSAGITPSLAGLNGEYFVTQMLGFQDASKPATVMHQHAKGLHIDEINLLANYFAQQKRMTSNPPKTQTLQQDIGH
jgi:cytochrome c553